MASAGSIFLCISTPISKSHPTASLTDSNRSMLPLIKSGCFLSHQSDGTDVNFNALNPWFFICTADFAASSGDVAFTPIDIALTFCRDFPPRRSQTGVWYFFPFISQRAISIALMAADIALPLKLNLRCK